ncbi:MAG: response regulator [Planctomycetes bacterium]|nr:response regulator [Planctomycetota bacterium]
MAQILLADDEPPIARLLEFKLRKLGHQVTAVGSGLDVLARLEQGARPDLVLLDWMMPGLDGIGTLQRLRADPRFAHIPVVLATAKGQERDLEEGLAQGARAYVVKPFDFPSLIACLDKILSGEKGPAAE